MTAATRSPKRPAKATDLVQASVSFILGSDVENLTLTGVGNINGTGNTGANTITGNTGNNSLDGGGGTDNLIGGKGDDIYVVDGGDTVTEAAGEGTDLVQSSVTFTLGANVENLTLTGVGNINGTGNTGANIITGNDGNNSLDGGGGTDNLIGGTGDDIYVVDRQRHGHGSGRRGYRPRAVERQLHAWRQRRQSDPDGGRRPPARAMPMPTSSPAMPAPTPWTAPPARTI